MPASIPIRHCGTFAAVRSLIKRDRTVINQIRGFLLEHGIPVRQGPRFLRQQLPDILARRIDVLSSRIIRIIEDLSGSPLTPLFAFSRARARGRRRGQRFRDLR